MTRILSVLSDAERSRIAERAQPRSLDPMLATLAHEPFTDSDWIFERKLDGVRLLAFRRDGAVRLVSRNHEDRSVTYPRVVEALEKEAGVDLVADGEVVAFAGNTTSFSRLQERMQIRDPDEARERARKVAVFYYLFDLLFVDGHDVTGLPLRTRKKLLRRAVQFADPVRFTPHRNGSGEAFLEEACRRGWEGLIAKRAGSSYVHSRSRDWLKLKCTMRQELVIGGWTDPHGERVGLGALLVGYQADGSLRYAGKVGTGYDDETLERLRAKLGSIERKTSPFAGSDAPEGSGTHWATPKLVCEVAFTEWTTHGKLRHPRFLGLRDDKEPEDVRREQAVARPEGGA